MVSPPKEVKNAKAFPEIRMLNDTDSRSANLCITILKKPRGLGTKACLGLTKLHGSYLLQRMANFSMRSRALLKNMIASQERAN